MKATLEDIFAAIRREREYQTRKWGSVDEHPHEVASYCVIMQGELDEAMQAWRKGRFGVDDLREVLQVIAVGVACLEQHGVVEREELESKISSDTQSTIPLTRTERGLTIGSFVDKYFYSCSIQESSLASPCIWFGRDSHPNAQEGTRMHLTQEMVANLIPLLQYFVETGRLPSPEGMSGDD